MELHRQTEPFPGSYLQGLLQHGSRLLPVRVLAEGADADLLVQVDVVPEGNCSYSACRCSLDLRVHETGQRTLLTSGRIQFQTIPPTFTSRCV